MTAFGTAKFAFHSSVKFHFQKYRNMTVPNFFQAIWHCQNCLQKMPFGCKYTFWFWCKMEVPYCIKIKNCRLFERGKFLFWYNMELPFCTKIRWNHSCQIKILNYRSKKKKSLGPLFLPFSEMRRLIYWWILHMNCISKSSGRSGPREIFDTNDPPKTDQFRHICTLA